MNPNEPTPNPAPVPSPTPAPTSADAIVAATLAAVTPTPSSPATPPATVNALKLVNSPGTIILQWLTYAFWGWAVLALIMLISLVLSSALGETDQGSFTPYAIAAALVLLPISLVCDYFYGKLEPAAKSGSAVVVMVIHAVIFALFGIGSLIGAVFAIVQVSTSSIGSTPTKIALYTSLIATVIYAATFVRTLLPGGLARIRQAYRIGMTVLVLVFMVLAFIGPVANELATKNDRLIVSGLASVQSAINNYARANDGLPASLEVVKGSTRGDAQSIIEQDLVTYTPNTKAADKSKFSSNMTYYYKLCANFVKSSRGYGEDTIYRPEEDYTSYVSAYSHGAGKHCYKLKSENY